MSEITLEEYQKSIKQQSQALLDVIQAVTLGNLDVKVQIPEGIEELSELGIGVEMMIDDLREMMAERVRADLVEAQSADLLDVIQSVALGDLDVQADVPEGVEVLSDLAVGINIMIDDLRDMMAGQVRADLVEEQSHALLDVVQSVALGDLDVEIVMPEGIEVLSDLAIGLEMMIDDLREMMAEQDRAREEIEVGRQQLEAALEEVLAVQRRYLRREWEGYTAIPEEILGYAYTDDEKGPTDSAWLPVMTEAVQQGDTCLQVAAQEGSMLAMPIKLYDEVIGAVGFGREDGEPWSQEDIAAVESIIEQVGWALESQRLFDEEQQARGLLDMRINELDCLNDIGRKMDEVPPIAEFLQWVTERIPSAMQFPDLALTAIKFNGQIYGSPEALDLPCQMVQNLHIAGQEVGRVCIAYTQDRAFLDEESALLGDIARRVAGYVENRRLLLETQRAARELETERVTLRTLIDNVPDVIYIKDAESRFILNNQAHLDALGAESQEKVVGKTDLDLFPEEFAQQYYADERRLIETGQPLINREETTVLPNGEIRWLLTTKVPLFDSQGRVTGLVGTGRDITERRQAEETLERRRSQLQILSDIGQKIGESPPVAEFLQWVAEHIPPALQFPDLAAAAIQFNGDVYGTPESIDLPCQIVQSLYIGGERVGRVCIAYQEQRDFLDEESALLGDITRRVSGYIENRRLLEQTEAALTQTETLYAGSERVVRATILDDILQALIHSTALQRLDRVSFLFFDHPLLPEEHPDAFTVAAVWEQSGEEPRAPVGTRYDFAQFPAGRALTRHEPLIVQNVASDERLDQNTRDLILKRLGMKSILFWPLVFGERWIGLLTGQAGQAMDMDRDEVRQINSLVDQAVTMIQNMRLLEETQRRAEELTTLNAMSRTLTSLLNVDAVLEEAYRWASELLDTTFFSIGLYDEEKDEFTLALHVEEGEIHKSTFTRQGAPGMSGHIIRNRQPLLIRENVREWQTKEGVKFSGIGEGLPPLSWLGVPLLIGDRVLGSMFVQSLSTPNLYDEHDQDLMVAIASQVSIALENARLLEETQAALAEVEETHRSYLRARWQDYLRQQEILDRSGFLYDRLQVEQSARMTVDPALWRPEMEQAVAQGTLAVSLDGEGDGERAGLAIPITVRGQAIGVLGVESPGAERQWSEDDLALIAAVSEQLGQTLESARLFADTQRRAERERLIGEITAKIRASTNMQDILQTAATELGEALGASRSLIRVGLEETAERDQPQDGPPGDEPSADDAIG